LNTINKGNVINAAPLFCKEWKYICGIVKKTSMYLKMYIGKELIENIPILTKDQYLNGHLQQLKQELEEKHEDIIDLSRQEPEYVIDGIPSRMNVVYAEPKDPNFN